jgi:photosystem II stability/assembly factor-like uncharacterized protein
MAACAFMGCLSSGGSRQAGPGPDESDPVVNLRMGVGGIRELGKGSAITLDRLEITFSSGANDTVRDTITPSTSPALNASATDPQLIAKNYPLAALRSWKMHVVSRDILDSVIHSDSAFIPVLYAGDTAVVSLNLGARYALYEAKFLSLPDSIESSAPAQPKQRLCIDRLVLKVDGAVLRDSTATPGPCFTSLATHSLAYDYIRFGTKEAVGSGTSQPLYAVHFPSADTGYIAGAYVALKTVDGGQTWAPMSGGNNKVMRAVHFLTGSRGAIAGGDDSSYTGSTTNGGATWTMTRLSSFNTIRALHMVNDTGWLAFSPVTGSSGSYSFRITLNGGTSWTPTVSLPPVYSIRGVNGVTAWAVGPNGVIRKNTSASGFFSVSQTSGTTRTLRSVFPLNGNIVIAVGDTGTILRTADGGNTWTAKTSGTTRNLNSVYFLDATTGFAVGEAGVILSTSDSGNTWHAEASPTTTNLNAVTFIGGKGYAVGDNGTILILNGPRLVEMLAYGPLGSWNAANPLYSGSKYINAVAGVDADVFMTLQWSGPTTGTGKLEAAIGRVGTVIVDGEVPGTVSP